MGTNIYLYVEHKKDHHWECVPFIDDISDYDSYYHSFYRNDMVGIIPKPKIQLAWNVGRDYKLFGLLAGVRGDIEPISFPKGLPLDISNLVSKEYRAVGNYGGSASYFSLKELLEVKDLLIDDSRFLPMFAYKKYKEDRLDYKISDWYFAATPGCKFVSNSEMERLINLSLFLDNISNC